MFSLEPKLIFFCDNPSSNVKILNSYLSMRLINLHFSHFRLKKSL
jgi:hypothetical protein